MSGSQKFIARNRAPRVQIEYDVELYGAEKKVQLPFVMGVLSDLSGKSEQPPVADRKFLEIDVDNFDERMKAMAPRAAFSVPNTITGEGNLSVDLTFERMEDFSPQAIAAKVGALAPLLEARRQLSDLTAYMDGKSGAETLIETVLGAPALLQALAGGAAESTDMDAALEALKARLPEPEPEDDSADRTLAELAARAPAEAPAGPSADDILGGIERRETAPEADRTDDVLASMERREETAAQDETADVLAGIERREEGAEADGTDDVLAGIERRETEEDGDRAEDVLSAIERREEVAEADRSAEVLAGIARREQAEEEDGSDDVLAGIERRGDAAEADDTADILSGIERRAEAAKDDTAADVLAGIARREEAAEQDSSADVLAGIERREEAEEADRTTEVLSGIERREAREDEDDAADVLSAIERREEAEHADISEDVLAGIERREDAAEPDRTDDVLAGLEPVETPEEDGAGLDGVLAGIETAAAPEPEGDPAAGILDDLKDSARAAEETPDPTDDILAVIDTDTPEATAEDTDPALAALDRAKDAPAGVETAAEEIEAADRLDDRPAAGADNHEGAADAASELDDLLADLDTGDDPRHAADAQGSGTDAVPGDPAGDTQAAGEAPDSAADIDGDLDDLLADLDLGDDTGSGAESDTQTDGPGGSDDLDDLLGDLGGTAADDAGTGEAAAATGPDTIDGLPENAEGDDAEGTGPDAAFNDLDDLLADLGDAEDDAGDMTGEDSASDDLDALLAEAEEPADAEPGDATDDGGLDDLDALLADLGGAEDDAGDTTGTGEDSASDDLDALLADAEDPVDAEPDDAPDDSGLDDLDALLADLGRTEDAGDMDADGPDAADSPPGEAATDDLDALLADLGASEVGEAAEDDDLGALLGEDTGAEAGGDLDDLLAEMGTADVGAEAEDDLDALLSDLTGDDAEDADAGADDLDALLAGMGTTDLGAETGGETGDLAEAPAAEPHAAAVAETAPAQSPFGTISAPKPERESMNRTRFRMAIFGDFTGRAARGLMETGDALAARRPIQLDVDTVEDVIEGFATTLTLPIGKDGAGIEVTLEELDDLHPDELYEKVEIFEAISGLRQQLGVGSMAGRATEQLKEWAAEFGTPVRLPKRSAATSVPPDLKLSDFQALIGDTRGTLTKATPADDLIARIVGPYVVKGPDAGAAEMLKAVDEALSAAMRLVLHHPDFQAVESQWRSLDLLARRIETDSDLQIVLYDVSAEEMAADLSAHEDLAQSGFYRLLTEVMDPEDGDGGFSALFGLYTFEETPPHAELLARIGQVAAHVDAPFFAAISPGFLETPMEERHKLVAAAWDELRGLPQAAWLGLASPRFMLRQPYGAKSDPCYEFEFEEFTPQEGLKGLLWANPVVLVAILLAATRKKDGRAMDLGSLMSLGDIPFTYVTDRYGDQVALPCTERNLTSDAAQATQLRGYMPVLSIKGRNEIRLGSFRSLAGGEIAGPWSDAPPARPAPPQATLEMDIQADAAPGGGAAAGGGDDDPLADLDSLLETGDDAEPGAAGDDLDLLDSDDDDDQSLDDLLASFADDDDAADDDDDMDPELAALLEGL